MNLYAHYVIIFQLAQHHGWSITELEEMLPWEREIYMTQVQKHIQDENKRIQEQQRR